MRDQGTYDLDALVRRAARSMKTVVRQFEKRCRAMQAESSDSAESARLARVLKNRADRTRMKLRDFHGRITHLVQIMQSQQVITRGEAQPVEERLTQLLAESLNRVEELLRRHERVRVHRTQSATLKEGGRKNILYGAAVGYRLIRRWRNNGRDGWNDI
ncbi:MAG: hypothetical protein COV76_08395 [Candidatus Omnitrophica bacterium CG11_big_fil_rev_8_21_14_0_20_64_10]|nr:MAG: hypothetical protein COV76_08395 [Candidatus Omnitrophica bacterium CG11_big_fil_rev_8_21_14_0_20_64_10]